MLKLNVIENFLSLEDAKDDGPVGVDPPESERDTVATETSETNEEVIEENNANNQGTMTNINCASILKISIKTMLK